MLCLLCNNNKLKKIFSYASERALWRCSSCGLLQTVPMPTDAELDVYYQKYDVLGEREPYYQKLWDTDALNTPEGKDINGRFIWAKKFCGKFGKTLDVGSGPGLFLRLIKESGGEAIGTELNARAAAKSAQDIGVRVIAGTINDVAERDFDAITLWDLLEHTSDPQRLIARCHSSLRDGGWLFVETPDEASLLDLVVRVLAKVGIKGPASTFYGLHHLVLFRRATALRLLETEGFKVVKMCGATTAASRIFRKNGFKDRMVRFGLGGLFLAARVIRKQNKMLIAAHKN